MVPIGARDCCPFCRAALAGLSEAVAERSCPRCGVYLWALGLPSGTWFFIHRPNQTASEFLFALAGPKLGESPEDIARMFQGADPFDIIEILGELDEASWLLNCSAQVGEGEPPGEPVLFATRQEPHTPQNRQKPF
jgi:hypothetical protein